jgi:hypothetical protein
MHFASLGMFIIDEFSILDESGKPTGKTLAPQVTLSYLHDLFPSTFDLADWRRRNVCCHWRAIMVSVFRGLCCSGLHLALLSGYNPVKWE